MSVDSTNIIENDIWFYLKNVESECKKLMDFCKTEYQVSLLDKQDLLQFISINRIIEIKNEIGIFKFHGSGCSLYYSNGSKLQWDFGYGNWWCGIDVFFVYSFLKHYRELEYSIDDIKEFCENSVRSGRFVVHGFKYYVLLYKISGMTIDIPKDYDNILISYKGEMKSVNRSTLTNRFVRKAICCYSEIRNLDNNYELFFYKGDKLIYSMYYNEMAFPEKAVDIMSKQILSSLFKK